MNESRTALRCAAARLGSIVLAGSALAACAGPPPAAWDKALLAKPEMAMSHNALAERYEQHLYESKEAAMGGYGVGGGGCGCN
jgi:hypothetical protein